jgi:hypothetical protein
LLERGSKFGVVSAKQINHPKGGFAPLNLGMMSTPGTAHVLPMLRNSDAVA